MAQTKFGAALAAKITGNIHNLVTVANACDLAYCEGTNNAYGAHVPFGINNPEKVAQNLAGLQAVVSGVSVIAVVRCTNVDDEEWGGRQILEDIVSGNLETEEEAFLLRLANATWGAGQSFRTDKGPLGRATRVNFFDDLDAAEVAKDWHQIKAAAKAVLNAVYGEQSAETASS